MGVMSEPKSDDLAPILLRVAPLLRAAETRDCVMACVGEGSGNMRVASHAEALANSLDVGLWIGRVLEAGSAAERAVDPIAWILAQQECRAQLSDLSARHHDAETVLLTGAAADRLIGWATERQAGFVALGARDCLGGFGLGATAQRLLENSDSSLFLVPLDGPSGVAERVGYKRILVPLDGSLRAEAVLPLVTRIARAQGAEVVLAHVTPTVEIIGTGADPAVEQLRAQVNRLNAERATAALAVLRAHLVNNGIASRVIVETGGDVRQRLHELPGELGVDLVVLSAHGSRGIETACGSVASYMASRATVPTIILRSEKRVHGVSARAH